MINSKFFRRFRCLPKNFQDSTLWFYSGGTLAYFMSNILFLYWCKISRERFTISIYFSDFYRRSDDSTRSEIQKLWTIDTKSLTIWLNVTHRSTRRKCSVEKCVLKNFVKFTRKHLCSILLFNKFLVIRPASLLKSGSNTGVSCEFCEIFEKTFFCKTPPIATTRLITLFGRRFIEIIFYLPLFPLTGNIISTH